MRPRARSNGHLVSGGVSTTSFKWVFAASLAWLTPSPRIAQFFLLPGFTTVIADNIEEESYAA